MKFESSDVNNWKMLTDKFHELTNKSRSSKNVWIFRGESEDRSLETYFERACKNIIDPCDRSKIESEMIKDFKRRYNGSDYLDVKNSTLYCLSLMQHHGAPTRLLDVSYSFYISAHFALTDGYHRLKKSKKKDCHGIIWCINSSWCKSQSEKRGLKYKECREDIEIHEKLFIDSFMNKKPKCFVYPENPYRIHQRLSVQKGLFLVPGNVNKSFEENLKVFDKSSINDNIHKIIFKFDNVDDYKETLINLHNMNISDESLFPGID